MLLRRSLHLVFLFFFILFNYSVFSQNNTTKQQPKHVSLNPYQFAIKDSSNYIFFPGTQISVKPPVHFITYDKINGFMHPGSSSTLQVKEIEGTPYVMYAKALTKEYFEQQGVQLVKTEDIMTTNGMKGILYTISFNVKGIDYERMILLTGDYNKTIWINANYPVMVKFLLEEPLKKSMLSVKY